MPSSGYRAAYGGEVITSPFFVFTKTLTYCAYSAYRRAVMTFRA